MDFDGESNNAFGSALAPRLVNTRHEISERQWLFPGMGLRVEDSHCFRLSLLPLILRPKVIGRMRLGN